MSAAQTDEVPWWAHHGYLNGRELGDGVWVCVAPMLFTYRLMLCTEQFVLDHYCYERATDALAAADAWDGRGEPAAGYVKSNTRAHGERWP